MIGEFMLFEFHGAESEGKRLAVEEQKSSFTWILHGKFMKVLGVGEVPKSKEIRDIFDAAELVAMQYDLGHPEFDVSYADDRSTYREIARKFGVKFSDEQ